METGTVVTQQRLGVKLEFAFGEDKLTRTVTDRTGEHQFSVLYEAVDVENPAQVTVNNLQLRKRLVYGLLVLWAVSAVAAHGTALSGMAVVVPFLLLGLFVIITDHFRTFAVRYTILAIPGSDGAATIRVMEGFYHDQILAELRQRWAGRLRKLHGAVNFANDYEQELIKFQWLLDHAVITQDEFVASIDRLKAADDVPRDELPRFAMAQSSGYLN